MSVWLSNGIYKVSSVTYSRQFCSLRSQQSRVQRIIIFGWCVVANLDVWVFWFFFKGFDFFDWQRYFKRIMSLEMLSIKMISSRRAVISLNDLQEIYEIKYNWIEKEIHWLNIHCSPFSSLYKSECGELGFSWKFSLELGLSRYIWRKNDVKSVYFVLCPAINCGSKYPKPEK